MISSLAIGTTRSMFGLRSRAASLLPGVVRHGSLVRRQNDPSAKRWLTSNPKTGSSAKEASKSETSKGLNQSGFSQMWNRFIGPKEMPPRWTAAWYREMVLVCTVFAITGSSTMVLVSWIVDFYAPIFLQGRPC